MVTSAQRKLINVPNSDAGKLHHLLTHYNRCDIDLALMPHTAFIQQQAPNDQSNIGLMLEEPAQRLIKAYKIAKKRGENSVQSFSAFYSEPNRINLYHRLFANVPLSALGFLGLNEKFYHSILLGADWLGTDLYRLPHNHMFFQSPRLPIKQADLDAIKTLYAKDYVIYERATALFTERWNEYQKKHAMPIAKGKQVFIHLGPPKTGTSAIQAWLHTHAKALTKEGIYYPEHGSDANGVSSGNFEHVISHVPQRNIYYFDIDKLRALITQFNSSESQVLLLSSEHFYYYLLWFFSLLPNAQYIFYIRHPLAIAESGFHQQVKRHDRTKPFRISSTLDFDTLNLAEALAKAFHTPVNFRYFDDSLYEGGSLLSDFACTINSNIDVPSEVRKLNTQYSPGAVKLMMACNEFATKTLRRDLDKFLQRYSEDQPAFSFISKKQHSDSQQALITAVNARQYDEYSPSKTRLLQLVNAYEPPMSCSEQRQSEDFENVLHALYRNNVALAAKLYKEAKQHNSNTSALFIVKRLNAYPGFSVKRFLYEAGAQSMARVNLFRKRLKKRKE
ncbi:hypothetical protein [Alteromonas sp. S015]|uniref:hypothetical protein n=1 Tax=Alteromonas sp. S015 TaxID=3117401 RepID=UPI002FDF82D2